MSNTDLNSLMSRSRLSLTRRGRILASLTIIVLTIRLFAEIIDTGVTDVEPIIGRSKNLQYEQQLINQTITKAINTNLANSTNFTNFTKIERDEKIIIYIHFHKAAGTSIVKTFLTQKKPWLGHHNGNPWSYSNGKEYIVEFWKYGNDTFQTFIHEARQRRTEFVAMEWNFFEKFNKDYLANVSLIACVRDPYERFVSNLFHNFFEPEYIGDPSLWVTQNFTKQLGRMIDGQYKIDPNFPVNYNKPNYYVAFMNGLPDERSYDYELNQTHLKIAKERLALFEAIFILERPETFYTLQNWLPGVHNVLMWRMKGKQEKQKIAWTRERFYRDNALDLEFYEYALNLSLSRLK